jgi:multiple sugar transport system permease protein
MSTAVSPARAGNAAPARRGGLRDGRPPRLSRKALPYLVLIPALVAELAIHIVPMAVGVGMSLLRLNQFTLRNWTRAPFVGLGNFAVATDLGSPVGAGLLRSLQITVAFSVLVVAGSWLLGLAAAVALQRPFRGRGTLRTLFLVPFALPVFTSVITWSFMLQRDTGLVNAVLTGLGLVRSPPFWLVGPNSFVSMVVVSVWRMWPFAFLTLTAGLQSVPGELYEASAVDGAGPSRRLWSITLPMLRPVNAVLLLVLFLWTFNDFNVPYILFGQSAPAEADVLSLHIYQSSFVTWNFGLGSAMSVLMLLFLLVLTAIYLWLTNRRRGDV